MNNEELEAMGIIKGNNNQKNNQNVNYHSGIKIFSFFFPIFALLGYVVHIKDKVVAGLFIKWGIIGCFAYALAVLLIFLINEM